MNEKPILCSGEMVRAILEDRKTQTRRVISPQPEKEYQGITVWKTHGFWLRWDDLSPSLMVPMKCPYGEPGDRLWVRETWRTEVHTGEWRKIGYRATDNNEACKAVPFECSKAFNKLWSKHQDRWRPSIFMPRWASRITLEITELRVQRLQHVSEGDARAEGVTWPDYEDFVSVVLPAGPHGRINGPGRIAFSELWDQINFERGFGWHKNPWVWVITFKRVEGEREFACAKSQRGVETGNELIRLGPPATERVAR